MVCQGYLRCQLLHVHIPSSAHASFQLSLNQDFWRLSWMARKALVNTGHVWYHICLWHLKNLVIIESYCASSCIINIIIYYLWSAECVLDAYMIIHWVTLELHNLLNYNVMLLPAAFAWEWYFSSNVVGSFIMWLPEQGLWILGN